jgi:hypothetical protein
VSKLADLVSTGGLPGDLAALVVVLVEHGLPLVVAARNRDHAAGIRQAFTSEVLADQPTRDAVAGGVVIGQSLEDVLRVLGAGHGLGHDGEGHEHDAGVPDEARDLGVVLVLGADRLAVAHYVRPVERDGAGHLQRRPPAVLGAWNDTAHDFDDFWWALTDELATRAGLTRPELEDAVEARRRGLADHDSVPGPPDARH